MNIRAAHFVISRKKFIKAIDFLFRLIINYADGHMQELEMSVSSIAGFSSASEIFCLHSVSVLYVNSYSQDLIQ